MQPSPALSGRADLERILSDLELNEVAIHEVTEGLSEPELNWQPDNGRGWSILQCVDHLALTNAGYTSAMRSAVSNSKEPARARTGSIRPTVFGALFLKRVEPPVKVRVRAPRSIVPSAGKSKAEALGAILESHEGIRALIKDTRHLDLNRLRFRNPFIPFLRVRVGTALLIIAAHERRHIWQAEQVRAASAAK